MAFADDSAETICAFCLMTSAGVRMAQDTNSAMDEAAAWITGVGIKPSGRADVVGLM